MSALRKMTNFLGYSEPVENAYEGGYQAEAAYDDEEYAPAEEEEYDEPYDRAYEEADAPEPAAAPDLRRIVTVHPSTYNEARVIGESFRDGVPVIVNLTNMSESDARRMVDFSAGLVFGLHGAIERVTPRVFLLTPASVDIDGGAIATAANGRFFNQS
ncbi:cell division protein SepF [Actinomyces israelii]|uniref:Cell division protein SepF n=1 Tax=Actinomyces israelii TaxID=1659 RepID=A0ABT4I7Y0_9ACTO|nr:cell division protein SepF [Actinomyces israelii]MCZ0857852.1 cell division protein SepF [Actinomyces israelii]WKR22100.1 Cell division protein SepF [Actinomyces israelii]